MLAQSPDLPFHAVGLPAELSCSLIERDQSNLRGREKALAEHTDGRQAAAQALAELGCRRLPLPGADRCPNWPTGFVGSISHTKNFAWAVAGRESEFMAVGIDTEPITDRQVISQLKDQIACPEEWQLVAQLGLSPEVAFTTVFSAKESIYKCLYPSSRIFFDFTDATVTGVGTDQILFQINNDCPNHFVRGNSINVRHWSTQTDVFTACWETRKEAVDE